MKIIGLCVVKNEADVVVEAINSFLSWGDKVSVMDNGSTDRTYELLQSLAANNKNVIINCFEGPFSEALRRTALEVFWNELESGDWICRLDGDEFYAKDTRFLLGQIHPLHHVVHSIHCQYYFTQEDYEAYKASPVDYLSRPPRERLHYYKPDHSEIRFIRYRTNLQWPVYSQWPLHAGLFARQRIRVKHYQYRSPQQIRERLRVRQAANKKGEYWWHGTPENWESFIADEKECLDDRLTPVEQAGLKNVPLVKEGFPRRTLKYIMHSFRIWV